MNYDQSVVLILYAQTNDATGATPDDIQQFDSQLFETFDDLLTNICLQEGLANDQSTKSLVLGCRPSMTGNTPDEQIRNACVYLRGAVALV